MPRSDVCSLARQYTGQEEARLVGNTWCLSAALCTGKILILTFFFILQPSFHKTLAHWKDFCWRDAMKRIPSPYRDGMVGPALIGFLLSSCGWIIIKNTGCKEQEYSTLEIRSLKSLGPCSLGLCFLSSLLRFLCPPHLLSLPQTHISSLWQPKHCLFSFFWLIKTPDRRCLNAAGSEPCKGNFLGGERGGKTSLV